MPISRPNYEFVGRVDAVVCNPNCNLEPYRLFISFEIERDIKDAKETESVMRLLGLTIKSIYPVIHILTDMNTFT